MRIKHDALCADHSPLVFQQSSIVNTESLGCFSLKLRSKGSSRRTYSRCRVLLYDRYYFTKNISATRIFVTLQFHCLCHFYRITHDTTLRVSVIIFICMHIYIYIYLQIHTRCVVNVRCSSRIHVRITRNCYTLIPLSDISCSPEIRGNETSTYFEINLAHAERAKTGSRMCIRHVVP